MNNKINLHNEEQVLSSLTGVIELFDGTHNVYFGALYLTNRRILVEINRLLYVEELSFWFEGESRDFEYSTFIIGEVRIKVKYVYSGNPLYFIKAFQNTKIDV